MSSVSRRLAAVWFADIVGFTDLASRDESAALQLVERFGEVARDEIDRHSGTLVKLLGDGALATFGSTAAALDAALSLREAFRDETSRAGSDFTLRIGVHMGDIVIAAGGDVYGDGVNVASRLQQEAEPGQVAVSQDVWRQCRQRSEYRFEPLGRWDLKGLTEPMRAYAVSRAADDPIEEDRTPPGAGEARDERAVAVLPFDNLSGTDEAEALAAGLHNDLLTELSKVSGLTVISRTSVRAYRNTDKPITRIARELDVGTVLEGSVQSAGNRVRLNVQLIDGRRDVHRWAERYDRELTAENLFDIQSELASRIIDSLRAQIGGKRPVPIEKRPTRDLEAYRLCAEGRNYLDQRTERGMRRGLEVFERSTERDPDYAQAWVGLADALLLLGSYGYEDEERMRSRADEPIRRALELDPRLAEAHASLGLLHSMRQDGPAAIRELERAVELRPGYAEAHNWLSFSHLLLGHPEPALESARRAVELNPLSPEALANLTLSYLATGEKDLALAEARRTVELAPGWASARFFEGVALYHLRRFGDAISVLENVEEPWSGAGPLATLALAQVAAGDRAGARRRLDRIAESGDFFAVGLVHAALGEVDQAFDSFRRAESPGPWPAFAVHHLYGEVWGPLRNDPRYGEVVKTVKRSWGVTDAS